ncbi:Elongation factor Tu [Trichinella pseudospiralis]
MSAFLYHIFLRFFISSSVGSFNMKKREQNSLEEQILNNSANSAHILHSQRITTEAIHLAKLGSAVFTDEAQNDKAPLKVNCPFVTQT